jgi:hypothetical protein
VLTAGYLYLAERLPVGHELHLMLINTIRKVRSAALSHLTFRTWPPRPKHTSSSPCMPSHISPGRISRRPSFRFSRQKDCWSMMCKCAASIWS